jgi:hypothetical protein
VEEMKMRTKGKRWLSFTINRTSTTLHHSFSLFSDFNHTLNLQSVQSIRRVWTN